MKKKILFIIPNLKSGGAEKSLVTLLQLFDYEKYEVSLFLFRKEGLFMDCIPHNVKVLSAGDNFNLFDGDCRLAVKAFLKKGRIDLAVSRLLYAKGFRSNDSYEVETKLWKYLKKSLIRPTEEYDCVIGYLEGTANWLASEIKAKKRIGYMHSFLGKTSSDRKNFKETIEKFNHFVAVSDICLGDLKKLVPEYKGFCEVNNIISPAFIKQQATKENPFVGEEVRLLTVGRISYEKGIDIATEACNVLKKRGYAFKWYHIGDGPEKGSVLKRINNLDVGDEFVLLGEKSNPYPYINCCDIYVQPSRHEGKSIAIDEAKCLQKPIVVTDFPSVYDQIENEVNGLICEIAAESLADNIERLINDKELRDKLTYNLSQEKIGNEEEIQKLYDLIES